VLSGRGLCDELITRPEESYRLCCVVVCDLENSQRRPWPTQGCRPEDDDDDDDDDETTPQSISIKYEMQQNL